MFRYSTKIFFAILAIWAFSPLFVVAQVSQPASAFANSEPIELSDLTAVIYQFTNFLIGVAPIIAVIFIVWGGITYMAAGADSERAARARSRIFHGFIGAIIIFGVGVLLSTALYFITGLSTGVL
ncbi:MAG: hypothetical protein COV29_00790 [Candidatus Yanofskybacteria bacterium CG10_big_fil_rev_8_21_14_0_10_36_16]|uniref:Conjugal transfer protein TrbC n=1 Tax=Candidatus Yanofskybacteria bacterium CG10_big_fil_rev_8_21_14_0_10_36_16 TaxID=1975096 RepID=A0A2J0Q7Z9_9BACT|nr:MAG: hypothetical protein COV29_00790 [Candidatus Yanofskybacteria bacterium CG10_big_fil_rev_8_21_14_0_10_36_16]